MREMPTDILRLTEVSGLELLTGIVYYRIYYFSYIIITILAKNN